jgi:hypothetical protein
VFAVIARSEATKQSILSLHGTMDCFAALAMTVVTTRHTVPVIARQRVGRMAAR